MKTQHFTNKELKKIMEFVYCIKPSDTQEFNRLKKGINLEQGKYNREVLTLYLATSVVLKEEIITSAYTLEEVHSLPNIDRFIAFFGNCLTEEEMGRIAYLTTLYSCFNEENYFDFLLRTFEDPQYFHTKEFVQTELYEKNIERFKTLLVEDEETFYKLKYLLAGVCKSCACQMENNIYYTGFFENLLENLKKDEMEENYLVDLKETVDFLSENFSSYDTSKEEIYPIHHFLTSFNTYYKDIYNIRSANDIAKTVKKRIKNEIQALDQLTHYCSVHSFIKLLEDKQRVHYFNFNFIKNQSSDELKALAVQFKQEVEYIERCIQTFTKADWEALELKNKQKMTGNYEDDLIYTVQFT